MILNDNLKRYVYDPTSLQNFITKVIIEGDGNIQLKDPTNPFIMLVEANTATTIAALREMVINNRNIYPSLAISRDELYHHMTYEEERNSFATPSIGIFRFIINVTDLRNYGIKDGDNRRMSIIKDTVIEVNGYKFTTEYDIDINYNTKTKLVYVEQDVKSNEGTLTNKAILDSALYTDEQGVDWILFDIPIKQMEIIEINDNIIADNIFFKEIDIEDNQYYYSEAYINKGNETIPLDIIHSNITIDNSKLSLMCNVLDGKLRYRLPSVYLLAGLSAVGITIKSYITKGKLIKNFSNVPIESFNIIIPNMYNKPEHTVAHKVNMYCSTNKPLDGGIDTRPLKDLRKKIIHNTTGFNDLPITELQLIEKGKLYGFILNKIEDTITKRTFIGSRNIDYTKIDVNVPAPLDVFSNRTELKISELKDIDTIYVSEKDKSISIRNDTLFISNNSITRPLSKKEIDDFNNMTYTDKVKYLNKYNVFYTPYTYIINNYDRRPITNVYNMKINNKLNTYILDRNNLDEHVFISNIETINTSNGYELKIKLNSNEEFNNYIKYDNIYITLVLPIHNSDKKLYIKEKIDSNGECTININTNKLPNIDDCIYIEGYTIDNEFVSLPININVDAYLYVYNNISYGNLDDFSKRYTVPNSGPYVVYTVHKTNIEFGKRLDYLYTNTIMEYTNRKYQLEENNVYLRYDKNIYTKTNNCEVNIIKDDNGNCVDVDIKLIARKGDIVYKIKEDEYGNPIYDENGYPVYEYEKDDDGNIVYETIIENDTEKQVPKKIPIIVRKKGDIKLIDGKPIIDYNNGVKYKINILMFEYIYKFVNKISYDSHIDYILELIDRWINYDIVELNNVTLENTTIYYKPNKSVDRLLLSNGKYIDNNISIIVKLYVNKDLYNKNDDINIKDIIGKIINKYFSKKIIDMNKLRKELLDNLPNGVNGIKVVNSNNEELEEIISIKSDNRYVLNKIITNTKDVVYDLDIEIIEV